MAAESLLFKRELLSKSELDVNKTQVGYNFVETGGTVVPITLVGAH